MESGRVGTDSSLASGRDVFPHTPVSYVTGDWAVEAKDRATRVKDRAVGVKDRVSQVVRESWHEVQAENITFMAGSIAYHAFISMLPLLLFLLVVLSVIGVETFTESLAGLSGRFLTPYARELLVDSLDATVARTEVSLVGAVTLLWGMSKIFRGLDIAFSEIYDSETRKTALDVVENAVVVFLALALAATSFVVAGMAVALFPAFPYPNVLDPVLLIVGLHVAFFPVYYVFPDVEVTVPEVVPGVVFAALGWTALKAIFQFYVTVAGRYEAAYGTLGSAFLLLIWLYFGSLILLLGGVLNAVLAGRTGDRHALHVTEDRSARGGDPATGPDLLRDGREQGGRGREQGDRRRESADDGGPARARDERARAPQERARSPDDRTGARYPEELKPPVRGVGPAAEERGSPVEDLKSTAEELDSGERDADRRRLRERVEQLEAETERLENENERLERERRRLKRDNADLARRLERRRRGSVWARAKRWVLGKRE